MGETRMWGSLQRWPQALNSLPGGGPVSMMMSPRMS